MASKSAKKMFEQEREKILADLPENVKSMFGQIGFCQLYGNGEDEEFVPVMIMNPYDVPPKPVRDIYWHDLYSKGKRSKSLGKLAYLVYHYGSDDPDDCYSFIEQEDFVPADEGLKLGYGETPAEIRKKLDAGTPLDEEEEVRVRGLSEMKEDLAKTLADRRRGVNFQERWESDVHNGDDDYDDSEGDDDDDDDDDDGDQKPSAKRQKK